MPGLMGRATTIVKAKFSKALDRAENPNETLDYSNEEQLWQLQNVKRGIADVTTAKKRLELQYTGMQQQVEKLEQSPCYWAAQHALGAEAARRLLRQLCEQRLVRRGQPFDVVRELRLEDLRCHRARRTNRRRSHPRRPRSAPTPCPCRRSPGSTRSASLRGRRP